MGENDQSEENIQCGEIVTEEQEEQQYSQYSMYWCVRCVKESDVLSTI